MTSPDSAPDDRDVRRRRNVRRVIAVAVIVPSILVVLVAAGAIAMRFVTDDPAEWHVDPLTAPTPSTPNSYRVAPVDADIDRNADAPTFTLSAAELATAFDRIALADARTEVLAGSADEGFVTYVQRSAFFAFPDYISVRFIDTDAGSTLAVFSRSRFGQSDLGVNKKRVTRWLGELAEVVD
jgi:uncharacterized protein (DUF1499 family)